MDEISLRFKEYLVKYGIKNGEVAEKMEWNSQKVTDCKGGKVKITPELALEFEQKFQINPCWLFFGRGNMKTASFDLSGEEKPAMDYEKLYKTVEELSSKVNDMEERYGKA